MRLCYYRKHMYSDSKTLPLTRGNVSLLLIANLLLKKETIIALVYTDLFFAVMKATLPRNLSSMMVLVDNQY